MRYLKIYLNRLKLLLFVITILIVNNNNLEAQSCSSQDSTALITLFNSTSGLNWDLSQAMTNWQGITVDSNGCVIRIQLDGILTSGTIPEELGNIQNLIELDLEDCNLTGTIPFSLGSLFNLVELDLEGNNLTGSIPTSLASLPNLNELVLIDNNLSGCYPPQLASLCNISSSNNQISDGNNFDGPWSDFCSSQLNECSCRYLDSISLIAVYTDLLDPYFDVNEPIDTWEGVALNENGCVLSINLDDEIYGGTINPAIGNFSELRDLNLNENNIEGSIPPEIGNLSNLVDLDLDENNLTGPIPYEMGNLTQVTRINLRRNFLTGSIPNSFINLINLNNLLISGNALDGCYDDSLYMLCNILSPEDFPSFGNYFDATWEDFCNSGAGECIPCSVTDSLSLVEFYNSSTGLNWNLNSPMSTWQGITVNSEGCVIRIQLDALLTSGTIIPEISNIEQLIELDLEDCNLTGSIPESLGNLSNLIELDLEGNNLTGSIPNSLADLTNLNELVLIDNQLSGCYDLKLKPLCNISSANNQISDGNNFDGPWSDFCLSETNRCLTCTEQDSLTLLTVLSSFSSHSINTDLPLGSWRGVSLNSDGCVVSINFSDCCVYGGILSPEIGNLNSLEFLDLDENNIGGNIPPELGNLSNLVHLNIPQNEFTGEIPIELSNLENLEFLNLGENLLTGSIPAELGNLSELYYLNLCSNDLSGTIPGELGELSKLQTLYLINNSLSGSIPRELGQLINLSTLSLSNNNLSGCFHPALHALCDIIPSQNVHIDIGYNSDASWEDFCNMEAGICIDCAYTDSLALVQLFNVTTGLNWDLAQAYSSWEGITVNSDGCAIRVQLDGMLTGGIIPDELGDMEQLLELDLEDCNLTGTIPTSLGNLSNLVELDLEGNQLIGSIPLSLVNLNNLNELVLIDNNLDGCYMDELAPLCNITSANNQISDGNNFDGPWFNFCDSQENRCVPCREADSLSLLAVFANFQYVDYDFSGSLDTWFGITLNQNECISEIYFDDCCISIGSLPPEIGNFSELVSLNLNESGINGPIPPEIGNLSNLEILSLEENNLSGEIPSEIGYLTNLTFLDLNDNKLSGNIPDELGNLVNLRYLRLNSNELIGSIPNSFTNLTECGLLRLDNNLLDGCYNDTLQILCNILGPDYLYQISEGNNFDVSWYNFCNFGVGACLEECVDTFAVNNQVIGDFNKSTISTITSDAQIMSGSTYFSAGQCVEFLPNFEVTLEAVFHAEINACQ